MKTLVKTLFTIALSAIVLSYSAFASLAADKNSKETEITLPLDFNKVVVTGNVKVMLIQCNTQSVVIQEEYNRKLTSVMQKGDKLYINSNEAEPIHVNVYLKDLQRIDVANSAWVSTRGKFSSSVLQVFLRDKARAFIDAEIGSLYTVIKDQAGLKLKGSTNDHTLVKDDIAKLKMDQFAALTTTIELQEVQFKLPGYKPGISKDSVIAERKIR
ncbi:GIN domain-containing protein [Pedobacter heparinus]|uniref:GIN domain-containing protein n=1 Tax=Pedobacter heparinus TaxID=984 RepID=UPI00292DA3BE|nr:DUF2807 domain-containing protein [Pedobacter heparinus]